MRERRTQSKPILRQPEYMLDAEEAAFPDLFDREAVVALFALRAVARRVNEITNVSLKPLGINAAQYNYLVVLYMSPGAVMTLSELSTVIHTSNATVTTLVRGLEGLKLVKRSANRDDGRSYFIRLTAKGRRIIEDAVPLRHHDTQSAMKYLNLAERKKLAQLLYKIGKALDERNGARA